MRTPIGAMGRGDPGRLGRCGLDHKPNEWNPTLNTHIEYVRDEFNNSAESEFLNSIIHSYKHDHIESGIHFAHGTPLDKREWVFPEDSYDSAKLNRIANQFETACICGHAHINGVFRRNNDSKWEFVQPEPEVRYDIKLSNKTIVTVGSVGQPRDEDPRASFVTLDGDFVTFHRVAYDFESTANKIRANPNIDNMYGERLAFGI